MTEETLITTAVAESGRMGRVAWARIAPNEDLVQGIEKICRDEGFKNAFVRGALGSLVDACLGTPDGHWRQVEGPGVEIVSLSGEVRSGSDGALRVQLSGVVADTQGMLHGGPFVVGANLVLMTFEVTLEEWLPGQPPAC